MSEVPWFIWLIVGLPFVLPTIYGGYRATKNRDYLWLIGIIAAWAIGMGWFVPLIYVFTVDRRRRSLVQDVPQHEATHDAGDC